MHVLDARKPCLFLMFAAAGTIAPSHSPAAVTKSTAIASAPVLKQQTLLSLANAHHRAHQLDSFTAATDTDKREMFVSILDANAQLQADLHASQAQLKKAHKIQCRARSWGLKRRLSTPTIFEIYLTCMHHT